MTRLLVLLISASLYAQSTFGQGGSTSFGPQTVLGPSATSSTPTLVQQSSPTGGNCVWGSGTSATCSLPGASVQTNILVALGSQWTSGTVVTASSLTSTNATWAAPTTYDGTNTTNSFWSTASFTGIPGTQTVTVNYSGTPQVGHTSVSEWSGLNGTLDGSVTQTNYSAGTTTVTIPSVTTTHQAHEVVFYICGLAGFSSRMSGPTTFTAFTPVGTGQYTLWGYYITTAAGAQPSDSIVLTGTNVGFCQTFALY